jgi:integrase
MSQKSILKKAGIIVNPVNDFAEVFRTTQTCRLRAARFEACQKRLLEDPPPASAISLANLCCFDTMDPTVLPTLIKAKTKITRLDSFVALDWANEHGALCRLALGYPSQLALYSNPLVGQSAEALLDWLASWKPFSVFKRSEMLLELRADQLASCLYNLPMILFSHVAGVRKMTPLPMESWARIESGCAVAMPNDDIDAQTARQVSAADFVDFVEEKVTTGGEASPRFITMVLERLSVDSKLSPGAQIDSWLAAITALSRSVSTTCIGDVLVVEWIFDLIESGTVQKQEKSSVGTRATYAKKAGPAIWRAIQAIESSTDSWELCDLAGLVETIKADPSVQYDQVFAAALGSFLAFLHYAYDLPLVKAGEPDGPPPVPRAQYITETEFQRTLAWIRESTTLDTDMKTRSIAALSLLRFAPLRLKEALHIRLRNIRFVNEGVELEIQTWRGILALKSVAAVRRVTIQDAVAVAAIRDLVQQRQGRASGLDDLLFGDIDEPKRISRKFVLHRLLLVVLKASTGDSDMTVHALRHSFCSDRMMETLASDCLVDFSRVNHLMYSMGHATAATLVECYSHVFELALRMRLDIQMHDIAITSEVASRISGVAANTLRQRATRYSTSVSEIGWKSIADAAAAIPWVKVTERFDLTSPQSPTLRSSISSLLTPRKTLEAICLLKGGRLQPHQIAQRLRISEDCVESISKITREFPGLRESNAHCIEWHSIDASLQTLGIRLGSVQHVKFTKLLASIDQATALDPKSVAACGMSWLKLRDKNGYWDASHRKELLAVLQLFARLDGQASQFAVCHTSDVDGIRSAGLTHQLFVAAFSTQAAVAPSVATRSDRPHCFVIFPTPTARGPSFAPAATSTNGLDVLMLTLTVYAHILESNHDLS